MGRQLTERQGGEHGDKLQMHRAMTGPLPSLNLQIVGKILLGILHARATFLSWQRHRLRYEKVRIGVEERNCAICRGRERGQCHIGDIVWTLCSAGTMEPTHSPLTLMDSLHVYCRPECQALPRPRPEVSESWTLSWPLGVFLAVNGYTTAFQ